MIAGYASVSGRTLRSVEQYGRVLAKSGVVRSVRTDDEGCAFVGFKGAGEYLIVGDRAAIWKAAVAAIADRFE